MAAPKARARVCTRFQYAFVFICDWWQPIAASHCAFDAADVDHDVRFRHKGLRDGVVIQLPDGMHGQILQIRQTAVAGQPSRVSHHPAGRNVIRMLVFIEMRRQHDLRLIPPDLAGNRDPFSGVWRRWQSPA